MANPTDFPREFPAEHAAKIGRVLIGAEKPSKEHLFPAYSVQGYGMGLFVDEPTPTFGASYGEVSPDQEKALGQMLIDFAEEHEGEGFAAKDVEGLPWGLILTLVGQIVARIIAKPKAPLQIEELGPGAEV